MSVAPDIDAETDWEGKPKSQSSQTDDEILAEARDRYKICDEIEGDNRIDAVDDLNFLKGGVNQWNPLAAAQRERDGRPIITVNTLPTYLHQVTNDQRLNNQAIKVSPVGDGADIETAKVRQGLIRHIEYSSNADVATDTAVNSAARIGFGFFRLIVAYCKPDSFDQEIRFQRIRNPLSVKLGPHIEMDGSDMKYAFIELPVPRDEFKREYPKAEACDTTLSNGTYGAWLTDENVLICEYYRIEQTPATVVLLSDGSSGFKDDIADMGGATIVKERKGFKPKVMWYKITGVDILERTEIKCRWIPVFPVYGDEIDIEGRVTRSGIIRHAKGPCQSYNVMISGATEEVALRTKAPYIGVEGQFEGHEDEWAQANTRAFPYLEYKGTTVDGKLAPPPQRQPMADVPTGMLALALHAKDNVKATTGLFDASLGAKGTATSGVQEKAQQREGDMANYHFTDSRNHTLRHTGRCLNCMIPHYYDGARIVSIMREDGTLDYAQINQQLEAPQKDKKTGAIKTILNDMTCGEYDVTVSTGPAYSTMRQESAEFFTNAMQAAKDPATASVVTYLAIKNQDAPGTDLATKMLAKLLPPPAQAVLEEENGDKEGAEAQPMVDTPDGPVPAQQAGQMIAQLMQGMEQAQEAIKQADGAKQQAEALKQQHAMREQELEPARAAVEEKKLEADIAKAEAAKAEAEAKLAQAQVDLVRAHAEAQVLPDRMRVEAAVAEEKAHNAANQIERETAEAASKVKEEETGAAEQATLAEILKRLNERPEINGMTIKAPSGLNYEVTVH